MDLNAELWNSSIQNAVKTWSIGGALISLMPKSEWWDFFNYPEACRESVGRVSCPVSLPTRGRKIRKMDEMKFTMSPPLLTPSTLVHRYLWQSWFFWKGSLKGMVKGTLVWGTLQKFSLTSCWFFLYLYSLRSVFMCSFLFLID